MTKHGAVYLFLGALEGMVSGVFAFLAGCDDEEDKILNYLSSAVFFLGSLIHVHMGLDALRPASKDAAEEDFEDL